MTLRCLARRHQALTAEIDELDEAIGQLCALASPALLAARGVGPEVASALLVAAGDNPGRLRTEASIAALCGTSPVEASSGKVTRHRLNQGGNREANNALWRIVMVRLTCDQRTRNYLTRRRAEGNTGREIIRCLKRYIAREIYTLITSPPSVPDGASLRATRTDHPRHRSRTTRHLRHPPLAPRTRPHPRRRPSQALPAMAQPPSRRLTAIGASTASAPPPRRAARAARPQVHVQVGDRPGEQRQQPDATDRRPPDLPIRPPTHRAPSSENSPISTHWLTGAPFLGQRSSMVR